MSLTPADTPPDLSADTTRALIPSELKHSVAFEQLLDAAENEVVGLIAYGLYKKDKRKFMIETGCASDSEIVKNRYWYLDEFAKQGHLANARLMHTDIVNQLITSYQEKRQQTLEKEVRESSLAALMRQMLDQREHKLYKNFALGAAAAIVGTIILAILVRVFEWVRP